MIDVGREAAEAVEVVVYLLISVIRRRFEDEFTQSEQEQEQEQESTRSQDSIGTLFSS